MISFLLYIDPGIGSLVAQVVIAGLAAFTMFFRNSFRRFFGKKKEGAPENKEADSE